MASVIIGSKKSIIDKNLVSIVPSITKQINKLTKKQKTIPAAIVFFDLSKSTLTKSTKGHVYALRLMLHHNLICKKLVCKYNGSVVKELGDGVLAKFNNPINACKCAVNAQYVLKKNKIFGKIAISSGSVEILRIGGRDDVFGLTVDRCARLLGETKSNQIMIDDSIHNSISSFFKDYNDVLIRNPKTIILRGVGKIKTYKIILK